MSPLIAGFVFFTSFPNLPIWLPSFGMDLIPSFAATLEPNFATYGPRKAPSTAPPTVAAEIKAHFFQPFNPSASASR